MKTTTKNKTTRSKTGGDFYNGIEWFACWLLDNVEGQTITKEELRPWAARAWEARLKKQKIKTLKSNQPIARSEVQRNQRVFIDALDRAIKFHCNNTNDPNNVGNAVIVALSEVRDAFQAYMR